MKLFYTVPWMIPNQYCALYIFCPCSTGFVKLVVSSWVEADVDLIHLYRYKEQLWI